MLSQFIYSAAFNALNEISSFNDEISEWEVNQGEQVEMYKRFIEKFWNGIYYNDENQNLETVCEVLTLSCEQCQTKSTGGTFKLKFFDKLFL